jgi:hypothetical protein
MTSVSFQNPDCIYQTHVHIQNKKMSDAPARMRNCIADFVSALISEMQ